MVDDSDEFTFRAEAELDIFGPELMEEAVIPNQNLEHPVINLNQFKWKPSQKCHQVQDYEGQRVRHQNEMKLR